MINSNELRKGMIFKHMGKSYLVLDYLHRKKGRGLATIRVKVKDVHSDSIVDLTFSNNERLEEEDVEKKSAQYIYTDSSMVYFMNMDDYSQFSINLGDAEDEVQFLKEGEKVIVLWMKGEPISFELPKIVKLEVKQTEPGTKGNTANKATKIAVLETGLEIQVPLFVKQGDVIRVNTEEKKYVSKAN